jgi:hypothetical protein
MDSMSPPSADPDAAAALAKPFELRTSEDELASAVAIQLARVFSMSFSDPLPRPWPTQAFVRGADDRWLLLFK